MPPKCAPFRNIRTFYREIRPSPCKYLRWTPLAHISVSSDKGPNTDSSPVRYKVFPVLLEHKVQGTDIVVGTC